MRVISREKALPRSGFPARAGRSCATLSNGVHPVAPPENRSAFIITAAKPRALFPTFGRELLPCLSPPVRVESASSHCPGVTAIPMGLRFIWIYKSNLIAKRLSNFALKSSLNLLEIIFLSSLCRYSCQLATHI